MQGILEGYKEMMCRPLHSHFSSSTWQMQNIWPQLTACTEVCAKQNAEMLLHIY